MRFLGQGGMGKVFLARDTRLRREVAIKFVHGGDPGDLARLLSEARAQARVDHERVCKVYEVGEAFGQAYIAMQYIAGETSSALARTLSVEQKAMLLRDVALGLHEAHCAGIIHRDVKPGNIMVERTEDGRLKPYVMDFGLARSFQEGNTETGTIMGTLHYMSPEQARGEVGRLDRRADVYSLGATLYYLLTFEPPVPGDNALEVLSKIAAVEPRPPRAIDPDIPADLEAIALKCLEKDRSARYDSARAVAEDLDRFLRGDPVAARPMQAWYRLRKRLVKHRRAALAVTVALLSVLTALGWGVTARREAQARERLARRFTELVERLESMSRYSALAPLHDIRADQAAIRARMEDLRREIESAGPLAVGPGHYALGRGYLALGDDAKAQDMLESAWQQGYREPRAAYTLALVLGHLYQEELREVQRIEQKELREAKKKETERRYRDPALAYLRQSEGAEVPSAAYMAALVAFYEGRLDDALTDLDAIDGDLPWFYEAPALRGDVFAARAERRWSEGDRPGALADFEQGRKAYAAAAAIGESVPAVHQAKGELEYAALAMEIYGQGDVEPRFAQGLEAVESALVAQPDHPASQLLSARLHRRRAEHGANRGENVDDLLAKAISAAERAAALAPASTAARLELGRAHWQLGSYRLDRNEDPSEPLRKALEVFEGIGQADRDYDYYLQLGLVFKTFADHQDERGADSLVDRGKAIDAYRTAIRLDERQFEAWVNLGTCHLIRAEHPRAKDAGKDLEEATRALDRARAINASRTVPYYYGSKAHRLLGARARAHGGDPRPELTAALQQLEAGLAINPRLPHLHDAVGLTHVEEARAAWDRGEDPGPLLAKARAAHEEAIAVAPQQVLGHLNLGWALLLGARFESARGRDPRPSVRMAEAALKKALEQASELVEAWGNLAMARSIEGAYELEQGRDPRSILTSAEAALEQALRRNPNDAQSHLIQGEVRATRALWESRKNLDEAMFEAAREEYQRAVELSPDEQDYRLAFGRFCLAWARVQKDASRDPDPALRCGLDQVKQVLDARPSFLDAVALRADLLLAQAEAADGRGARGELAEKALADFTRALAGNPNLEHAFRGRATLAQRLAAAR
ncbi:serine/threonine-protein kinase [Polyangium sp. 6x1]|uniref:serine/threonine-protein kinase n=1 Tax=Polyangium sp. 6x1 TaxID=3042689 RepID=UPI00248265E4|nr:serine/threonine-protein kinase [Polyangium sp. 6x1]MDI1448501.1 protein kinase [Polyangium sp. 6x1]